jgi:hypothetical protein
MKLTDLQAHICHDGSCSCYQVLINKDGNSYDCDICDCGALRKAMREMRCEDLPQQSDIFECWMRHLTAISRIH